MNLLRVQQQQLLARSKQRRNDVQQHQVTATNDTNEQDDYFLTPIQVRAIRKEIVRKRANHRLPTIYMNPPEQQQQQQEVEEDTKKNAAAMDTTTTASVEQQIIDALLQHEHHLVQVRGIASSTSSKSKSQLFVSDNDTRTIRNAAERLAYSIQKQIRKQAIVHDNFGEQQGGTVVGTAVSHHVHVVEIKGHVATLFYFTPDTITTPFQYYQQQQQSKPPVVPALVSNTMDTKSSTTTDTTTINNQRLQLRTTGKRNDWTKRPKAIRNNAGQIVKPQQF